MIRPPAFVRGPILATVLFAACAAPSRYLTTRVVDDPIVLPRRMAEVSMYGDRASYSSTRSGWGTGAGFRLGLTNRMQWTDVLSLTYAFLDDAPGSRNPPSPFSLSLRAGATSMGGSSSEGFIVFPLVTVAARKHLGDRWRLASDWHWLARWVSTPRSPEVPYSSTLGWWGSRWADLSWWVGAIRQLTDHVALHARGGIYQTYGCADVWCDPVSRSAYASLSMHVRPWSWLTLSPYIGAGARQRLLSVLVDQNQPTDPVVVPLMSVRWLDAGANAAFNW
jgi:hypothetical protein